MINYEELENILTSEFDYTEFEAKSLMPEITGLQPQTRDALAQWMKDKKLPSLEVQGFTVDLIMQISKCNPVSALLTLDWLLTEPEIALAAIKHGFDLVE